MTAIKLFGLSNCDTVKRARAWLAQQGLACEFHDFKRSSIAPDKLQRWLTQLGHAELVNRRGTTWRQLAPALQAALVDDAAAMALMQAHSSVIKRPVVEWPDGLVTVGFDAQRWAERVRAAAALTSSSPWRQVLPA